MRRACFEITDILWHAYGRNSRVTGIQRVQLNLIRYLVRTRGGHQIRCVFFNWLQRRSVEFDPNDLFDADEYDGEKLLRRLALVSNWTRLPSKHDVRQYLQQFRPHKALRAWKKMELYFWALFCPKRFYATGLVRTADRYPCLETIQFADANTQPSDALVFLGGSSSLTGVIEFAIRHQERGGLVVQLMHDLIPVLHSQYCTQDMTKDFSRWLTAARRYVTHFICVSQNTAHDLRRVDVLSDCHACITVLPLAHEFKGFPRNVVVDKNKLPPELDGLANGFVLCVGTIEPRKNGVALLECWRTLHRRLPNYLPLLIFAGKHGWHSDEFDRLMAESDIQKIAKVVDAPSDDCLAALYHHCLFTVFPSLYEGWGLPVGESAWFGKLCVTSDTASMPEVCGQLVDYIDPTDPISIISAIHRAILDVEYRKQREQQIKLAKLRTWDEVANDLLLHIEQSCGSLDTIA